MKSRWGILLLVLSVVAGLSHGATLYVDDDAGDGVNNGSADYPFRDIQQAVDAAAERDTVIVAPGHYLSPDPWDYAEIGFKGKNIRLVSSAPTDFSVIEQTVLCGVVIFWGTEDANCLLQGFKIQNHGHGGILGSGTAATISHCIISGNGPCGGTVLKDCYGRISNCLIVDNSTFHACGLMPVISGCLELINCTIANNLSGIGIPRNISSTDVPWRWPVGSRVNVGDATAVVIRNCIIYGNQGLQIFREETTAGYSASYQISDCLIENLSDLRKEFGRNMAGFYGVLEGDPCFVRLGNWTPGGNANTLTEGDYHLKSEGYRWSEAEVHGSHWYFDGSTSPAIDAGDPMESWGEELERVPEDAEGRWGINRAIDLGAYGGTTQASLAPNRGNPPGVGAVDLYDYWPLATENTWWPDAASSAKWQCVRVVEQADVSGTEVCTVTIRHASSPYTTAAWYCVFTEDGLYNTQDANALDLLPQVAEPFQMRYPRYLTIGSTIQAIDDPFAEGIASNRSVTILRGTLEEVHAGTTFDLARYVSGSWLDVIAMRSQNADGTPGDPVTVFARGFGPLMLNGKPVGLALVRGTAFASSGPVSSEVALPPRQR